MIGSRCIMLSRYPDTICTFVTILNIVMRINYTPRSARPRIERTPVRKVPPPSPSKRNDDLATKKRSGEQYSKMAHVGPDALVAPEETFLASSPPCDAN